MRETMQTSANDVLKFWFGDLDQDGMSAPQQQGLWFKKSAETDATIRKQFSAVFDTAVAGDLDHWASDAQSLVALIVVLDQFSRNIHRDSALAFAADDKALGLALNAIESGLHKQLPAIHRVFLYLPLEHSEDLAMQERCVKLFQQLADENRRCTRTAGFVDYAIAHRDVIREFGRFPHRNAILGRTSTAEEVEYLKVHGGF